MLCGLLATKQPHHAGLSLTIGVLRLRSCFAKRSSYSAQDDILSWSCGGGFVLRRVFLQLLLGGGTQVAIGAEFAIEAGLGLEFPGGDVFRYFLHPAFRRFQLSVAAPGHDRAVSFQVIEHQAVGAISPLLARRQGVDGKLHALVGIFLRLGPAGLVVGNHDSAVCRPGRCGRCAQPP